VLNREQNIIHVYYRENFTKMWVKSKHFTKPVFKLSIMFGEAISIRNVTITVISV